MSDCSNYWQNAIAYGEGGAEVAHLFPVGWGAAGETRSDTIRRNAIEGLWLPLFIPEGCEGHVGALDPDTGVPLPEVIFYTKNHVPGIFDQKFGDDADARYAHAVESANEAGASTGHPYVREAA